MKLKKSKTTSKFDRLKGKAMDRNGMGMELALLVLLVVFGCSLLLVTSALTARESLLSDEAEMEQRLVLDEVGEYALTLPAEIGGYLGGVHAKYPGYYCNVSVEEDGAVIRKYKISDYESSKEVLTVVTENGKVTSWEYK